MTVLEAGPGPGTFTMEAAAHAEPGGKVIAVDVQPQMLSRLRDRIEVEGTRNVEPRLADIRYLPLADSSVDRAFMVTVLAEIPSPVRALMEIRRVMKPDGVLSVSEFAIDPDFPWQSTVIRWCDEAGFQLEHRYGSALNYTLNFVPAGK
jgi:ubiquinone/menaquinone biosynthesis C-methylase UbiE